MKKIIIEVSEEFLNKNSFRFDNDAKVGAREMIDTLMCEMYKVHGDDEMVINPDDIDDEQGKRIVSHAISGLIVVGMKSKFDKDETR